jgi:hypothetical protein
MNLLGYIDTVGRFRLSSNVDSINDMVLFSTAKLYQNCPALDGIAVVNGPATQSLCSELETAIKGLAFIIEANNDIILYKLIDPTQFC